MGSIVTHSRWQLGSVCWITVLDVSVYRNLGGTDQTVTVVPIKIAHLNILVNSCM